MTHRRLPVLMPVLMPVRMLKLMRMLMLPGALHFHQGDSQASKANHSGAVAT